VKDRDLLRHYTGGSIPSYRPDPDAVPVRLSPGTYLTPLVCGHGGDYLDFRAETLRHCPHCDVHHAPDLDSCPVCGGTHTL